MIFIFKKRPFTQAESARMASWTQAQPVIVPGRHVQEPYASLFAGRTRFADYIARARTRVDPVYDDRPFFFATVKPWGLPRKMRDQFATVLAVLLPLGLLVVSLAKPRGERTGPYLRSIVYFASLGIGFIAVELSLLQHLTLLLGHPIFTLSILLFTLLASGGLGSWQSGRFRLGPVCLATAAVAIVYALALPRVVPALLALALGERIAIAILLLAPLGFLMGMPFPKGLRETGQGPLPPPPLYWGLNGLFSVVGSIATMLTAVILGFTWAMLGGASFYLLAALCTGALGADGRASGLGASRSETRGS
jgi:hypothetical protein